MIAKIFATVPRHVARNVKTGEPEFYLGTFLEEAHSPDPNYTNYPSNSSGGSGGREVGLYTKFSRFIFNTNSLG